MKERNWKYKINGGWPTLIMASVMLAIFGGITVWLYTTRNGAFIGGLIVTACMAIGFILSVCSVLFFKVFVDKDGFFCQTAPGNGRYYRYSEIRNMWLWRLAMRSKPIARCRRSTAFTLCLSARRCSRSM